MTPSSPPERYVDANELAHLMGVSRRTVERWTAAGMPSETWGMGHTRRYRASEAMAWARERAAIPGRIARTRPPALDTATAGDST